MPTIDELRKTTAGSHPAEGPVKRLVCQGCGRDYPPYDEDGYCEHCIETEWLCCDHDDCNYGDAVWDCENCGYRCEEHRCRCDQVLCAECDQHDCTCKTEIPGQGDLFEGVAP